MKMKQWNLMSGILKSKTENIKIKMEMFDARLSFYIKRKIYTTN